MLPRTLAAALALLAAVGCARGPGRIDVVLVSVDTLRADFLGAYGRTQARTPRLDRLAREGRLFLEATTPFPRTTPAVGSLLTGLWPARHGSRDVGRRLRDDVPTLAQLLAESGWASVGVSANLAAGRRQGLDRGFERFQGRRDLDSARAGDVTDRALALVSEVPASRPLFLWVHYLDPHFPYDPPADVAPASAGAACRALERAVHDKRLPRGAVDSDRDGVSGRALGDCVALYADEIAYTDREVGRLLDGLERAGRLDRALVVLTADHGENLGEAGLFYEHGPSVHDASLRVPLVFAGPGVEPGTDAGAASLEDVAPTVLEWVGLPAQVREGLDGESLAPRLRGAPPPPGALAFAEGGRALHLHDFRRPVSGHGRVQCANGERFSLCRRADGRVGLFDPRSDPALAHDLAATHPEARRALAAALERWRARDPRERTARTPRFKLVVRPRLDGPAQRLLYDLAGDPGETRDVGAEHPEVRARLAAALERWSDGVGPDAPTLRSDEVDLLRRLGYVE